jgi:hypothetical protein
MACWQAGQPPDSITWQARWRRITCWEIGVMDGLVPKLLSVVREKMRTRHLARRTEQAYLQWIRRDLRFHDRRHPR